VISLLPDGSVFSCHLNACNCDVSWICSLGSQCLVEVPANETFVESSDVPSVILSAFQSIQRQNRSSPVDDSHCDDKCDIFRQSTTPKSVRSGCEQQSFDRDCIAGRDAEQCLGHNDSDSHSETRRHWRPLLLVIPLRLGLSEINPVYYSAVKASKGTTSRGIFCLFSANTDMWAVVISSSSS